MLPTVLEETEEDLITPDQVGTSSQPDCYFKSGQSFSASSSNGISIYPLDITDIIKGYNQTRSWSSNKPSVSILTGEFGVEIITLYQLLKMGEVLKSTEFEMASSSGQQIDGSASQSPSLKEMESTFATCHEDTAGCNGALSSEKVVDANTEVKEAEQSNSRNRKDSESGRSVGEDGERRNSGNGGRRNYRNGNNRNGGKRNNARRQRDKKWWVCPDPACRTRNSIEATGCNNCGMVQEKRGGRPPYARNWEKARVTGMSVTHVSSPTVVYGQTQQQQLDYARLRNCMAQAYAESSYRPSLVAAKMLLGVKIGEGYERVRTEERLDQTPSGGDAATQEAGGVQEDKDAPADSIAVPSSPEKKSATPPRSPTGHESPVHSSPGRDSSTSSSSIRWRVQLVDRGSWGNVREADLHFLLAGLSDLAPLAAKYTLNELRLKRDSTDQQMEQSRLWLEEQTKDVKVDCDVYRQTKDGSSVLYLDMYKGETLLNRAICELGGVEPKTNLRWLKPNSRVSTSSVEEGGAASPLRDGRTSRQETHSSNPDGGDLSDCNNDAVTNESNDAAPKEQRRTRREGDARQSSESRTVVDGSSNVIAASGDVRVFAADKEGSSNTSAREGRDRSSSTATGNNTSKDGSTSRRGGWWNNRRRQSRETQQRLPPLQDWAVLCFDPRTAQPALRAVCELVERAGREGGRSPATAPDSIRQEGCEDEASMVAVLADTIASHPRLLLLLCVLPQHLKDYSGLERTGRSLGVCVVCIRGESLADFDPSAASRLLKDLQSALLNSPAILPYQGFSNASNASNNDDNNDSRRENRNRRNQNRRRGSAPRGRSDSAAGGGRATSPHDGSVVSDPRLQAVIGAASQGISLLQKLSQQPGGQLAESALSPGMKSLLQSPAAHQDIAKALESLEDLQVSYKQARTYTHEAFQAAGSFFSHLSNAITPPVTAAE